MYKLFFEVIERCGYFKRKAESEFSDDLKNYKEELIKTLNEEQLKKFEDVLWTLENHFDDIYEDFSNSAIWLGFKLGMEFKEFLKFIES